MKAIRTAAERIFLGKNTASFAGRFEFHLWALIALLLVSATGSGLRNVAALSAQRNTPVSGWLTSVVEISSVTTVASVILCGYLMFAIIGLVLLGIFVKGEEEITAGA